MIINGKITNLEEDSIEIKSLLNVYDEEIQDSNTENSGSLEKSVLKKTENKSCNKKQSKLQNFLTLSLVNMNRLHLLLYCEYMYSVYLQ